MLPSLNQLKVGQAATIVAFSGGWGIRQRLQQVGLHVGDMVRLKRSAVMGGPLLLSINEADIALSRCLAAHIFVRVMTPS
ncbi:ferrous iron transport protein A [bacterium]|nr:ferrous iron transport protein A [bacterium]